MPDATTAPRPRANNPRMDTPSPSTNPHEAVRRIAGEHAGRLYALASRFCRTPEEAEDLVQEVFLQALRDWHTFRGDASETTWLYRIAARTCQRMHRPRAGEPARIGSLDDLLPFGDPLVSALPAPGDDGARQQIHREARERLEAAIAGLPDEFRVPLVLKEIVGMGVREVAEVLGIQEGTVRSRLHRARLRLRAAVDGALPRTPAPPPAYDERTCMDLLNAKQEALDRGVPFDSGVICQRCRSVFDSLDLTQELCQEIGRDALPPGVRERLAERLARP
jgi:RNA polymerase sigma-70 factor (ECF subfamily)